jgi:prepilin-type N-terminal cleavage/methylation domain-containing protein
MTHTSRKPNRLRRPLHGFTLVELLVVIGIIALLISVLLPSLNKARQAGHLVDCQVRLQQMGQALHVYVGQNKGLLPWGGIDHTEAWTDSVLPNASNNETFWWWMFTLSEVMNRNMMGSDGLVNNLSPVFRDRDTIDHPAGQRFINHYTANPRLLYRADVPDDSPYLFTDGAQQPIQSKDLTQRKITSVRKPSDVFVIWDGPQALNWTTASNSVYAHHTYGIAESIDGWGWNTVTGLCYDVPKPINIFNPSRPIAPGGGQRSNIASATKLLQKRYNFDAPQAFGGQGWLSHFRFRHMDDSRLAALCLDGHVETRAVGTVMVRDVFTNYR